jgi:hypothetical protein
MIEETAMKFDWEKVQKVDNFVVGLLGGGLGVILPTFCMWFLPGGFDIWLSVLSAIIGGILAGFLGNYTKISLIVTGVIGIALGLIFWLLLFMVWW